VNLTDTVPFGPGDDRVGPGDIRRIGLLAAILDELQAGGTMQNRVGTTPSRDRKLVRQSPLNQNHLAARYLLRKVCAKPAEQFAQPLPAFNQGRPQKNHETPARPQQIAQHKVAQEPRPPGHENRMRTFRRHAASHSQQPCCRHQHSRRRS